MTAVVSVETVLLVVLVVLVAGLLRSHAEILRRLGPPGTEGRDLPAPPGGDARDLSAPPGSEGRGLSALPGPRSRVPREAGGSAPAVAGTTPAGDAVSLSFEGVAAAPTLLAFLTSGCSICAGFWESLGERRLPPGVQTVIVARGADREQPARLRKLAPRGVPVVMSSVAWDDYEVPGAPYFVLVDGAIRGEGVATTWHALSSLVSDAIEDQHVASGERRTASQEGRTASEPRPGTSEERGAQPRPRSVDETLAAAGIGPDHPSLYPAGRNDQ
jgi:hypothetical protein